MTAGRAPQLDRPSTLARGLDVRNDPPAHATTVADHTRTRCGGGLCPTCRFCADRGITPHLCITRGDQPDERTLFGLMSVGADSDCLVADLAAHPAQPMPPVRPMRWVLRPVHGSWCSCQCSPNPATAPAGGARS